MKASTKQKLESSTHVASSAAALGGAAAAGNAGKLALLKNFGCEMDDVDVGDDVLDWEFHPTVMPFGSSAGRYKVAAIIMNSALILAIGLICIGVATAIQHFGATSREKSLAMARLPGILYIPYLFLLQGTSLVSAQICFAAGSYNTGTVLIGAIALCACLASPILLHLLVLKRVSQGAVLFPDPAIYGETEGLKGKRHDSRWYKFCFGDAIWVTSHGHGSFAERYGIVFENLRSGHLWFVLAEIVVILGLSLMSGWKPSTTTTCDIRNYSIAVLVTAFFLAALIARPFIATLDNVVAILLSGFMSVAVVLMSICISFEIDKDSPLYAISALCLLLSAVLVFLKCVWDFGLYIFDLCISRRSRAREVARQKFEYASLEEQSVVTDMSELDPLTIMPSSTLLPEGPGYELNPSVTAPAYSATSKGVHPVSSDPDDESLFVSYSRMHRPASVLSKSSEPLDGTKLNASQLDRKHSPRASKNKLVWV